VEKRGKAGRATYDNIRWRMHFACWITKATYKPSEYVMIVAFPRQQWLHERAPLLPYAHIACLVGRTYKSARRTSVVSIGG
jgi:hypothetical protein